MNRGRFWRIISEDSSEAKIPQLSVNDLTESTKCSIQLEDFMDRKQSDHGLGGVQGYIGDCWTYASATILERFIAFAFRIRVEFEALRLAGSSIDHKNDGGTFIQFMKNIKGKEFHTFDKKRLLMIKDYNTYTFKSDNQAFLLSELNKGQRQYISVHNNTSGHAIASLKIDSTGRNIVCENWWDNMPYFFLQLSEDFFFQGILSLSLFEAEGSGKDYSLIPIDTTLIPHFSISRMNIDPLLPPSAGLVSGSNTDKKRARTGSDRDRDFSSSSSSSSPYVKRTSNINDLD